MPRRTRWRRKVSWRGTGKPCENEVKAREGTKCNVRTTGLGRAEKEKLIMQAERVRLRSKCIRQEDRAEPVWRTATTLLLSPKNCTWRRDQWAKATNGGRDGTRGWGESDGTVTTTGQEVNHTAETFYRDGPRWKRGEDDQSRTPSPDDGGYGWWTTYGAGPRFGQIWRPVSEQFGLLSWARCLERRNTGQAPRIARGEAEDQDRQKQQRRCARSSDTLAIMAGRESEKRPSNETGEKRDRW